MLTRKIDSICKRKLCRYLSSLSLNKTEIDSSVHSSAEKITERERLILTNPDYFKVHKLFTVKDLFDARVHYGHKITSLNDKMKPFLFGSRLNHVVFDLDITAYHLREALNFAAHIAYREGIILFISRNPKATLLVENTALECKEFAVTRDWKLGAFTDSAHVFKNEVRLPDLCIILNTMEENGNLHPAVIDAAKMLIPTIGIVDSNCDPNLISYPVPGNDDSYSSVTLYCKLFKEVILKGKNEKEKHIKEDSKEQADLSVDVS